MALDPETALRRAVWSAREVFMLKPRSHSKALLSVLAVVLGLVPSALGVGLAAADGAAPGVLDPSFGGTGVVTTAIPSGNAAAAGVAIQSDGKIVAAGYAFGVSRYVGLVRYNTDGSIDTTFGTGGYVTTSIGSAAQANAVAIQADDNIVIAGNAFTGTDNQFLVARYTPSGALDPSFGIGGVTTTQVGTLDAFALGLAIQADGRLVLAGRKFNGINDSFVLARYTTAGMLDATFSGGVVTAPFGSSASATSVVVQSDNRIVAAGRALNGAFVQTVALARYKTDGTPDMTFGTAGRVTTQIGGGDSEAHALRIQSDAKIVAAGSQGMAPSNFALARYMPDGSLDTGFGTSGELTTAIGSSSTANALVIHPDGKIVAAGKSSVGFALARYTGSGALDTGFGTAGITTTAIGTGASEANGLALQSDGKLVAAGDALNGGRIIFALARYGSETVSPTSTFYFAEGTTLDGFREYLLLANPTVSPLNAAVTYFFDDGSTPQPTTVAVPADGRATVDVVTVVGAGKTGVSIGVSAPGTLVAERAMYFDRVFSIGEVNGSHGVLGAQAPKTDWTFAEGSTQAGFQEYLTLQNPGGSDAHVTITYGVEGGGTPMSTITVPAGQRRTVDVDAVLGPVTGHSSTVHSDQPVLAERPEYFIRAVGDDNVVINGGHVAFGSRPATKWSFAEGTVLPDFATYLTLANPDPLNAATAWIEYFFSDGTSALRSATVAAASRHTVRVFDATDPAGVGRDVSDPVSRGVSFEVTTTAPSGLVAERPEYFHHVFVPGGTEINDGHDVPGAKALSTLWSFAEGSTLSGFFPFLTIENPNPQAASITIKYAPDQGAPVTRQVMAGPTSRLTVQVYGDPSQGGIGSSVTGFGIFVSSSVLVLVERPIYVDRVLPGLPEINGGSDVIGLAG
jgi:uncharacterized delta-60 repeat protein